MMPTTKYRLRPPPPLPPPQNLTPPEIDFFDVSDDLAIAKKNNKKKKLKETENFSKSKNVLFHFFWSKSSETSIESIRRGCPNLRWEGLSGNRVRIALIFFEI